MLQKTGNICTSITLRHVCVTKFVVEKMQVLHILSVCVALFIQHAMHMCCMIFISVASLPVPFFPHYPINGTIFRKKKIIEHEMCFDFVYNFCLKLFSF